MLPIICSQLCAGLSLTSCALSPHSFPRVLQGLGEDRGAELGFMYTVKDRHIVVLFTRLRLPE